MQTLQLKIFKSSPSDSKRLCETCSNSVIMRGAAASEEIVHCHAMGSAVAIRVVDCNRYCEGGRPSLWDMRQIAWVLDIDNKRQRIGFLRAAEWRRANDDQDVLGGYIDD